MSDPGTGASTTTLAAAVPPSIAQLAMRTDMRFMAPHDSKTLVASLEV
jgi:hypothetical protein